MKTRIRRGFDAVSVLTVYLALLLLIESRLVIGPLGGAGSPAMLVALGALVWWALHHLQRSLPSRAGPQPLRAVMLATLLAFLASYVVAMSRPISGQESSTALLGLITVVGWMGVGLLTGDGVPDLDRFQRLVGRLVVLTGAMAALGVAQFVTHDALVRAFRIPGLTPNAALTLTSLGHRDGFTRPFGTALHPIEYGAVLTMVLPLAVTWARHTQVRPPLLRWMPVTLMGLGAVLSVSRSALICGAVGLVVLAFGLGARARTVLLVSVLGVFGLVALTVPGMLGALRELFVSAGTDNSVASRTGSYSMAMEFFTTSPVFGRGYSTFLPAYRIFDNQYLLLLVEVGLVGLVCVVTMLVLGVRDARRVRRVSTDAAVREHAQALAAGLSGGALGLAFYDGFSFPMATGVMFVMLGMVVALYRLTGVASHAPPGAARLRHRSASGRT